MTTRPAGVRSVWAEHLKADHDAMVKDAVENTGRNVTRMATGPASAGGVVRVRPYDDEVIRPDSTRGSE